MRLQCVNSWWIKILVQSRCCFSKIHPCLNKTWLLPNIFSYCGAGTKLRKRLLKRRGNVQAICIPNSINFVVIWPNVRWNSFLYFSKRPSPLLSRLKEQFSSYEVLEFYYLERISSHTFPSARPQSHNYSMITHTDLYSCIFTIWYLWFLSRDVYKQMLLSFYTFSPIDLKFDMGNLHASRMFACEEVSQELTSKGTCGALTLILHNVSRVYFIAINWITTQLDSMGFSPLLKETFQDSYMQFNTWIKYCSR